ncbi:MAG: heparinase II/III family protein, partial [Gluconacetobacter sp.]
EIVEGERAQSFDLRFHLHPAVGAEWDAEGQIVMLDVGGRIWKFRADGGTLAVEESIYCGAGKPERTRQIVIHVRPGDSVAAEATAEVAEAAAEPPPDETVESVPVEGAALDRGGDHEGDGAKDETKAAAIPEAHARVSRAGSEERTRQIVRWGLTRVEG